MSSRKKATNALILEMVEEQGKVIAKHVDDDKRVHESMVTKADLAEFARMFVEIDPVTGDPRLDSETRQMIPRFAMKKDVEPLVDLYRILELASKGGSWLGRSFLGLVAILIGVATFKGYLATFIAGLVNWAMQR